MSPILKEYAQELNHFHWDEKIQISGSVATTDIQWDGTIYTIKVRHRSSLDQEHAKELINDKIDTVIILMSRYIYNDVSRLNYNSKNHKLTRTFKHPENHKEEDRRPTLVNFYDENRKSINIESLKNQLDKTQKKEHVRSKNANLHDQYAITKLEQTQNRINRICNTIAYGEYLLSHPIDKEKEKEEKVPVKFENIKSFPERKRKESNYPDKSSLPPSPTQSPSPTKKLRAEKKNPNEPTLTEDEEEESEPIEESELLRNISPISRPKIKELARRNREESEQEQNRYLSVEEIQIDVHEPDLMEETSEEEPIQSEAEERNPKINKETLRKSLAVAQRRNEELEEQIKKISESKERQKIELNEILGKELQKNIEDYLKTIEVLEQEKQEAKDKLDEFKLMTAAKENEALHNKIKEDELESQIKEITEKLQTAQSEKLEIQKQYDALKNQIRQLTDDKENLSHEKNRLLEGIKSKMKQQTKELNQAKYHIKELEEQNKEYKQAHQILKNKISKETEFFKQAINRSNLKSTENKKEVDPKDKQVQQLTDVVKNKDKKIRKLTKKVDRLQENLKILAEERKQEINLEFKRIIEELQQVKEENVLLQKEVEREKEKQKIIAEDMENENQAIKMINRLVEEKGQLQEEKEKLENQLHQIMKHMINSYPDLEEKFNMFKEKQ